MNRTEQPCHGKVYWNRRNEESQSFQIPLLSLFCLEDTTYKMIAAIPCKPTRGVNVFIVCKYDMSFIMWICYWSRPFPKRRQLLAFNPLINSLINQIQWLISMDKNNLNQVRKSLSNITIIFNVSSVYNGMFIELFSTQHHPPTLPHIWYIPLKTSP